MPGGDAGPILRWCTGSIVCSNNFICLKIGKRMNMLILIHSEHSLGYRNQSLLRARDKIVQGSHELILGLWGKLNMSGNLTTTQSGLS